MLLLIYNIEGHEIKDLKPLINMYVYYSYLNFLY